MPRELVFLHGFMGHASDWDEVRSQLPEFETRAINIEVATDWHGTVRSLTSLLTKNSIVVGYSMGARLALGIALEFPEQCAGLIFVSGNPGLESETERAEREIADEKIADRIAAGQLEPFLQKWYQSSVFTTLPEEIRDQEIERKLGRDAKHWPEILRVNSVSQQPNYWPRLHELVMPTWVVAGERDEKYKTIANRVGEVAQIKVDLLPNCGHMVHREKPLELASLIRDFIKPL